jgi:hypothetical protein
MSEVKLRGAMGAIQKRRSPGTGLYNEFQNEPVVSFDVSRHVLPRPSNFDEGIQTVLEIRVGASFTVFKSDPPEAFDVAENNAMRALCRHLYADVLDDLIAITQAVGDGKRRQAMNMLNDLFTRLSGNDV